MTHICGFERSQIFLLPEAVDDYVGVDNPVRFIDAFADELDLAAAGFVRAEAKATGRPGYAPADLLKLYIYGYLNRVRSSRRLEMESHRNIEVIWLLRSLKPDFKTTASPPKPPSISSRNAPHPTTRKRPCETRRLFPPRTQTFRVSGCRFLARRVANARKFQDYSGERGNYKYAAI
jgi:Transposase domain (DUF772)